MMLSRLCSFVLVGVLPAGLFGAGIRSAKPTQPNPAAKERIERLSVEGGKPAVRKGTVEGHASQSYVVAGRKGQKLAVDLRSTSSSLYFNLRLAGSPEALYASDRGETGNTSEVTLPVDGDYQIDVYL